MVQASSTPQQYFVGINGQQTGPFTESDLLQKISGGQVPQDALIWFQGLSEWQSIKTIPIFNDAFGKGSSTTPAAAAPAPAPAAPAAAAPVPEKGGFKPLAGSSPMEAKATYQASSGASTPKAPSKNQDDDMQPVFGADEAVFSRGSFFQGKNVVVGAGVIFVVLAVSIGYIFYSSNVEVDKTDIPELKIKAPTFSAREIELRKALSEFLLSPDESMKALNALIDADPNDAVGKEALGKLLEFHSLHNPLDGGRLLLKVKRPAEAAAFFLKDPPSYSEAQKAYAEAALAETDPAKKRQFMLEQIRLLLGPLQDRTKAVEVVQAYEKAFPGEAHPYKYYLKKPADKLVDLFERLSFVYVQTLTAFIESELPQINLKERPKVELKKEKDGKFRVVGEYQGDVILNRDRLAKIYFLFWNNRGTWHLVDTNLTSERQKWTKDEREKRKTESLPLDAMLSQLESQFQNQFPKLGLHEKALTARPEIKE